MDQDKNSGFYIMHKSVPPSIGIQYAKVGNDPGMSYNEAVEYVLDHQDFWVLDGNGKVIFSILNKEETCADH
jgi:hypothetical protein